MNSYDNETHVVLKGGILGVLMIIIALPVVIIAAIIAAIADKKLE